jgi:Putative exonuclease SbcCD, C subunit
MNMSRRVSALPSTPEDIVARLHHASSAGPGYQLHRVILCNYWHFGLLTFEIPHGRLFLTGDNATGKSTALVAAMLTLDGDVRPHRLDTFGSAERQIAAYVLGARAPGTGGGYEHASRTSLVATEWAWHGQPDAEHPPYLTLGLTFVGKAGNADPVRTWRFLLLDGARLDKDIDFLDASGRLLDARTLRTRLGAHGQVHDRVEAYKAQVAQHLFGFRDRRDMDRLIDWLLLLRKPNLTSRLSSFSEVTAFLRQALPPLPAESTLQVTETFDRLVALRQALDERLALADAADRIIQEQQAQRLALARLRAYDVRELGLSRQRAAARLNDKRHLVARLERELAAAEQTLETARNELAGLDEEIRKLEASADIRSIAAIRARLAAAEADAARAEQTVGRQRALLEQARAHASAAQHACAATQARWQERLAERKVELHHLQTSLAQLRIEQFATALDGNLLGDLEHPPSAPVCLTALLDDLHDQTARLARLVEHQEHVQHTRAALQRAEARLAEVERAVAEEQARVAERAQEVAHAWQQLGGRIQALVVPTGDAEWNRVLEQARRGDEPGFRAALGDLDARLAADAVEQLARDRACGDQVSALHARQRTVAERATALADEPTAELGPVARSALGCLAEAGIEARPFGALVAVAPGISDMQAGQIERALSAAGLLEALVVLPPFVEAATARLARADVLGALLRVPAQGRRQGRHRLPLIVDPSVVADSAWAATAADILAGLPAMLDASASGQWEHGALGGQVAEGMPAGLLGAGQRQARREQELEMLRREQTIVQSEMDRLAAQRRELAQRHEHVLALRTELRRAPDEVGLAAAQGRLFQAQETLARVQVVRDEAARSVEKHRPAVRQRTEETGSGFADLSVAESTLVEAATRLGQLRELERDVLTQRAMLDGLHDVWLAHQSARQRQVEADGHVQALVEALAEAQRQHAQAQADVARLRVHYERPRASDIMGRLDRARDARRAAEETLRAADRQMAVLTSRCEDARLGLAEIETSATEADLKEETATAALAEVVDGDPEPALEEAARYLHQADALGAANVLLGGSELDRPSLERACTTARDRFVRVFAERRPLLAEMQPFIEDDVVRVRRGDRLLSLSAFRPELAEEIAGRRALITDEEEQLFTSFLLDGAAGQIGEAIRRAEAWVDGINAVLARIPLVHERYVLELRPGNDLSGPLARHYALFRTSPDALSSDQRQTLLEALREATGEAQRRHEQDGGQFVEELERLLDYRAWLRLEVAVIGASGQRVVLTDRVAKTRSGAEQMMAQYVPLFAALSALYDLAAPWAPRLLALDEAFDKASDESSQQMLRFLVGQEFQWLMTSPRLTGQGNAVPVYAEYLMVHERASRKAYGIPFFAETVAEPSSAA